MKLGSLFSGFGGLDLAVEAVFGARTVWVSDIEPGPCKVLAHRFPGVPNLGDITRVDWSQVEPVDIIAGGSPCQDISAAGRMAGMVHGSRSNLWVHMREAIRILEPMFVVWENVGAARSTKAASASLPDHLEAAIRHHQNVTQETSHAPTRTRHQRAAARLMERRTRLVGDHPAGAPVLRALGRVLGDLASLGYDAGWHSLRAADVGAPHGRLRFFVLAANHRGQAWLQRAGLRESEPGRFGWGRPDHSTGETQPLDLLPTPDANLGNGGRQRSPEALARGNHQTNLSDLPRLLPTPTVRDYKGHNQRHDDTCLTGALLPTPSVADATGGHERRGGKRGDELLLKGIATHQAWGPYAAAIARWETIVGPAPAPTKLGRNGRPKLNPAFAEWMMGAPAGWITDVPGVTDNEALKMAGNGVVRQQAEAAMRLMLDRLAVAA